VKPFGFLTSLLVGSLFSSETIAKPRKGRRPKPKALKPIASFDRDPAKAAAKAFDRETGETVSSDRLRSYADALVQYHIHPEGKFLNGDYLDQGATVRRHVRAVAIRLIGKESADWEEMMFVGLMGDPVPNYGVAPDEHEPLLAELRDLADRIGRKRLRELLHLSPARLRALLAGHVPAFARLHTKIAVHLPEAQRCAEKAYAERASEIERLHALVCKNGLRATATALGLDPSNLRRRLMASAVGHMRPRPECQHDKEAE
jgi:hypothetical protein